MWSHVFLSKKVICPTHPAAIDNSRRAALLSSGVVLGTFIVNLSHSICITVLSNSSDLTNSTIYKT